MIGEEEAEVLRSALPAIEADLTPAKHDEIKTMVGKLAILYPNQKLSDGEAQARVEMYAELLSDIPGDVLSIAFAAAAKTLKFFPSVAEIRERSEAEMKARHFRKWKAEQLLKGARWGRAA